LCLAALALQGACARAAPAAEYALRWDPADGGPATIEAVLSLLALQRGKAKQLVVQYYAVPQPPELPAGFAAIARERTSGDEVDATYKVRGPTPLPGGGKNWTCPLAPPARTKSEVDIGIVGHGVVTKSYSRSCSVARPMADSLPTVIHARPLGCTSSVTRIKARDVKVEQWQLAGGNQALEVSWAGKDSPADLQAFRSRIVEPLTSAGIKPLSESKTELGSIC